ncbi:MAG: hypothetical protein Q8O88_00105 [bacterium]|nr:hypothetical protein [bacterium]
MKRIYLIIVTIAISASVFAQIPQIMSYQAVVRDTSNKLVISTVVGMQISVLQGSSTGIVVYKEIQEPSTNINGLVGIEIGNGSLVFGDFANIDWANGPYFIKTETDPTGGSDYTIIGISQLMSVPYALYSKTAETVLTNVHYVGELIGSNGEDGVVFFVDHTGQHGLICSITDIDGGSGVSWYNGSNITTGATNRYNGVSNSASIINIQGDGSYAAKICEDYFTPGTTGGDWYLPSVFELDNIFRAKYEICKELDTDSFMIGIYWSSTEIDNNNAMYCIINGSFNIASKAQSYGIRAVRKF